MPSNYILLRFLILQCCFTAQLLAASIADSDDDQLEQVIAKHSIIIIMVVMLLLLCASIFALWNFVFRAKAKDKEKDDETDDVEQNLSYAGEDRPPTPILESSFIETKDEDDHHS